MHNCEKYAIITKSEEFCNRFLISHVQIRRKTMYEDEKLVCEDCGAEFIFTAGEQEFYAEKGLVNKPKRCPDCRKLRRQNNRKRRKMYDAVCSKCGAQTQVPFKPIPGKEVYCKDCFAKEHQEQQEQQ